MLQAVRFFPANERVTKGEVKDLVCYVKNDSGLHTVNT